MGEFVIPPELVTQYLRNRRKELIELRRFLGANDSLSLKDVGHRLKGTGPSYGFREVGEMGSRLERAAGDGDLTAARQVVDDLERWLAGR